MVVSFSTLTHTPSPAWVWWARWTSSSRAYISPAFSEKEDEVFTWVGIIMYLPPEGDPNREAVTQQFDQYVQALEPLYEEYGAVPHWAKVGTVRHAHT